MEKKGPITRALTGKTVEYCFTEGERLTIRCEDGTEVLIKWVEPEGPVLERVNTSILLPITPTIGADSRFGS